MLERNYVNQTTNCTYKELQIIELNPRVFIDLCIHGINMDQWDYCLYIWEQISCDRRNNEF